MKAVSRHSWRRGLGLERGLRSMAVEHDGRSFLARIGRSLAVRAIGVFGLVATCLLFTSSAWAHQSSHSYSTVQVDPDGAIHHVLVIPTSGITSPPFHHILDVERNAEPSNEQIKRGEERLFEHVLDKVRFSGEGGRTCLVERDGFSIGGEGDRSVELRFRVRCPTPGRVFLQYELFFDVDSRHTGWLKTVEGKEAAENVFKDGIRKHEINVTGGLRLVDFITHGVRHIFSGYDHIAFILGLLIVTAIRRNEGGPWQPRGLRGGVLHVAPIVTAFTLAHSLTLMAAALDWVTISPRIVESAIAASIVYIAIENVFVREPRFRWALAFGFGLVHGMGFASLLRPLLPPGRVIVPLLTFNVGIELGQLAILAVAYPVLHGIATWSPTRYRSVVVLGGSLVIGLFGCLWLVERAFRIAIFPSSS